MDEIVRLVDMLSEPSDSAEDSLYALATVVNTKGSVYRRPGARMLIAKSMRVNGAVSAGCLERDIIAQCESLTEDPRPLLLTYDGESADELIFGLRLGCDGIVQILVEPATLIEQSLSRLKDAVPDLFSRCRKIAAVTIFAVDSDRSSDNSLFKVLPGTVLLASDAESVDLKSIPANVRDILLEHARAALSEMQSKVIEFEIDGVALKAFVEVSLPRQSLLVFGAGQDTAPIVKIAEVLGWQTTHIKDRNLLTAYEANKHQLFDACLIMTHDYEADKLILQNIFNAESLHALPAYIGIVGPKRRSQKLFAELALAGIVITTEQQSRVYSPVGLDIGAERPEEIALSILAEIQAVRTEHNSGFLRDKEGPIHSTRSGAYSRDEKSSVLQFPEHHALNSSCHILDA